MRRLTSKHFAIGPHEPLVIMSGPCVIESEEHCLKAAETLQKLFHRFGISLIFKSSYDKANRSSYDSFRGPGLYEGLRILQRVQEEYGLPVVTDVHSPEEARAVGEVCEIVQIPAFLCRQTDLIVAAAQTPAIVSVKKGQFMAPWDMEHVVRKITTAGNDRIILVDRGTSFGYNQLVSDFRSLPIMQQWGFPVCYDATHSVQTPGGLGSRSGGHREFIPPLIKAALAVGVDCLFMESHPNPPEAKSDAASVVAFQDLEWLLPQLKALYELIQGQLYPSTHE